MKKLNTNNTGRMPLWQADLDWLQQAYTEPIEAIINELARADGAYMFPVSGCKVVISGGTIAMSAGWFWWNGELLPVRALAATSISGLTNPVVWLRRVTHADPDGSRNFIQADQSAVLVSDVWQDDYLHPEASAYSASHPDGVLLKPGAWTLADRIKKHAAGLDSGWKTFTYTDAATGNTTNCKYRQIGQTVVFECLNLQVYPVSPNTTEKVAELPPPLCSTSSYFIHLDRDHYFYLKPDGSLWMHHYETNGDIGEGNYLTVNIGNWSYTAAEPYAPTVDMNVIICEP